MIFGNPRLTVDQSVRMHRWSRSLISTQLLMIIKWHTNPSPERDENNALCSSWRWNCCGGFLRWPPRDTGHAPALIKPANAQQITVSASSSNLWFSCLHQIILNTQGRSRCRHPAISPRWIRAQKRHCVWYMHVLVYKLCIIYLSKLNFRNGCIWTRVTNGIFMLTVYTSFM